MKLLIWQEQHPTVHGGAESWLMDTAASLRLLGHQVAWLQDGQIERAVTDWQPDAVVMGTLHCFVGLDRVAWLVEQHVPAIWFLHDYWPFCSPRMLMRDFNRSDQGCEAVAATCFNSCGGRADHRALVSRFLVATGCEGAAIILRRNGIRVGAVVEEGIDTGMFAGGHRGVESWLAVYASAAGAEVWKGLHVLAEATKSTHLSLRVLMGLSRSDLAAQLGQARVYAFPSVYQETWGLALTEAMACGCAVVASDVAGARAQVHEGLGVLVPPRDPDALRDALLSLSRDRQSAREMGQAAREHVRRHHGLEALGKRWERVCEKVAKGEGVCQEIMSPKGVVV